MHNGYTNECPDPGGGNRLKKINKNSWIFVLEITLMVFICIMHSINAGHYANYYPINGTFQNFNPVRRLLAGQIPYRDFQDYLGLGHLYTGSIFTGLYGGDYQVSDGELREKQTANYFSDIYPIDCAVLSANAQSYPKCCTLLPVLLSA